MRNNLTQIVGMGTVPVPHRPDGSVLWVPYPCRSKLISTTWMDGGWWTGQSRPIQDHQSTFVTAIQTVGWVSLTAKTGNGATSGCTKIPKMQVAQRWLHGACIWARSRMLVDDIPCRRREQQWCIRAHSAMYWQRSESIPTYQWYSSEGKKGNKKEQQKIFTTTSPTSP